PRRFAPGDTPASSRAQPRRTPSLDPENLMNPSASILQLPQRLTFAALLSLGVACGSSAEPAGERQQPISQDGSELSAGDACAGGVAPETAAEGECLITARNLCFASREAACAC